MPSPATLSPGATVSPEATASPGATTSPTATVTSRPTPAPGSGLAPTEFDPQRAFAHVQALADDIGSRAAGTEAERAAANYIAEQLQSFGYRAEQQSFVFQAFVNLGTTLEVTSPRQRLLEVLPLEPSIAGLMEAEIVNAGLGRSQDFPSATRGKIALIRRGEIFFSDKVGNAAVAGAAAAIIYNDRPGLFGGTLVERSAIPAVSISQEEGQFLLDLLASGPVKVRLDVRVQVGPQNSQNVIGRPPDEACHIYVGGHYDSVPAGPGGNDNASGTATVLEIARVLAADGEFDPVCFIAFGAEEPGLIGSARFVAVLPVEDRRATIAMLNFDMVGVGSRWLLAGSSALTDIAAPEAQRLGLAFFVDNSPPTGSDHASFIAAGIPATFFHGFFRIVADDPRYHSPQDRAEFVDPQLMGQAGRLGLAVIDALLRGR